MSRLIISEKAIAGKTIAGILAGKNVSVSSIASAQVFRFRRDDVDYLIVPLRGHISDVEFPKKYSYWMGTDVRDLIDAPIDYVGKERAIISGLKQAALEADEVIIATDADREGESIGVEALNYIKEANKKIVAKRAYFSAITPKDINAAFANLADVDYNFADSADARREIDLIWGAVLTRFISIVSGRLGKEYLSVGRVQTPTLAIIVAREKERNAFEVKKYWEIKAVFKKGSKKFEAEHKNGKFWEIGPAEAIMLTKEKSGVVKDIKSSQRTLKRPTPFNTTDFLRQATTIGFSAGEAMDAAESLYQQGYTSYPRTDNTVYSENLDLREILQEVAKVPDFAKPSQAILAQKTLDPSRGKKETKDHPPIHPATAAPKEKLSERHWKIYELIVRRFLATLSQDAKTENQSVEIHLGKEPFVARGQRILEPGWKDVYPYSTITEVILPKLEVGEEVALESLDLLDKETQPPARYSQSTLIKLMEDMGIGTKSTRHTIIQKLFARRYITGTKAIEPSKIAFAVIDVLDRNKVDAVKAEMTSRLEEEMDQIAAGKHTKKEVIEDSRKLLHLIVERMVVSKDKIGSELRVALREDALVGPCDKCDGQLRILKSRNNKRFLGCTNYPKCTNTYPLPQKGRIVPTEKICPECKRPVVKLIGARYRFEMCVNMACPTKDDWKKRQEEKKSANDAEKPAPTRVRGAKKAVAKKTKGADPLA
ncbi:MAG: DNA topoisomerase I [archaeon]|nr:DNA topoisomerase I [archaeon]